MKFFILIMLMILSVTVTSCGDSSGESKNFTLQGDG